jgi:hypothetical protein
MLALVAVYKCKVGVVWSQPPTPPHQFLFECGPTCTTAPVPQDKLDAFYQRTFDGMAKEGVLSSCQRIHDFAEVRATAAAPPPPPPPQAAAAAPEKAFCTVRDILPLLFQGDAIMMAVHAVVLGTFYAEKKAKAPPKMRLAETTDGAPEVVREIVTRMWDSGGLKDQSVFVVMFDQAAVAKVFALDKSLPKQARQCRFVTSRNELQAECVNDKAFFNGTAAENQQATEWLLDNVID